MILITSDDEINEILLNRLDKEFHVERGRLQHMRKSLGRTHMETRTQEGRVLLYAQQISTIKEILRAPKPSVPIWKRLAASF